MVRDVGLNSMDPNFNPFTAEWSYSGSVCALADDERHLGHIVKVGANWHAFDATHFNEQRNGFRSLGTFASLSAAKAAVEQSRSEIPGSVIPLAGAA